MADREYVVAGPERINMLDTADQDLIRVRVRGDTYDRFVLQGDGTSVTGTGSAPPTQSGTSLTGIRGAAAGTDLVSGGVTADANDRWVINADGKIEWGPGTGALDSSLARVSDGTYQISAGAAGYTTFNLGSSGIFAQGWNGSGSILNLAAGTFSFNMGTNPNRIRAILGAASASFEVMMAASPSSDALKVLASDGTTLMGSITKDGALRMNSGAAAGATATGGVVSFGTGAPVNASGANGDIYLRVDGGALTTIYQRRAGAWVGIV